jgi:uncharacterized protein YcbX
MTVGNPTIHAIYRYPVKGLSPEPLERATLAVHETLPADRLYAIERTARLASTPPHPAISPSSAI